MRYYSQFGRISPIFLPQNCGKGYAMAEGVANAHGDILLFVDADLENWNADYGAQMLAPLLDGKADMVLGYPYNETNAWDRADVWGIQRWLTGERAVWRKDLLPALEMLRPSRFGVETLINMHYRTQHQPIRFVNLDGLAHVIKFEKCTRQQAWQEYSKEIREILRAYVRYPKLTAMTYIPDLIEVRAALRAFYGWTRRTFASLTS
jgi:glycosyltransferase involved in cell wall biosynthesis